MSRRRSLLHDRVVRCERFDHAPPADVATGLALPSSLLFLLVLLLRFFHDRRALHLHEHGLLRKLIRDVQLFLRFIDAVRSDRLLHLLLWLTAAEL